MAQDFENMSIEELQAILQEPTQASAPQEDGFIKRAGDTLTGVRAGFHEELSETGEDIVSAGRRFVTDPLGITDSKVTRERERTLGKERAAKKQAVEEAGLSGAYGLGKGISTLGTVAVPGGLAAKGAKGVIQGPGLARAAGRLALGQGGLGAAVGGVRGQGDVGERAQEAAKSAALFTAAGGVAGAVGAGLGRAVRSPVTERILERAKVTGLPSQKVQSEAAKKVFRTIEDAIEKIPGTGIKKIKIDQVDQINKSANELFKVAQQGDQLIRESGKTINRIVSASPAKVADPKLVRSIERIKSGMKANGHTSALSKLTKKIPEADIKAIQEGTMPVKRMHELRKNLDDVIQSIKSGSNVGGSKGGLVQLKGLRTNMENTLKKSIAAGDKTALKQYNQAKKVFQEGADSRLVEDLLNKSMKTGDFNRKAFQNGLFTLKNKGKLSFQDNTKIRQLTKVMDDVIKLVGTKSAPKAGLQLPGLTTGLAGAGAGVAGAATIGGPATAGLAGAAILGARTLLATPVGQKVLLRYGRDKGGRKVLMDILGRVGAEAARRGTEEQPEDTASRFDDMSVEELQELLGQ